jgi:hypothetical protein
MLDLSYLTKRKYLGFIGKFIIKAIVIREFL